MRIKSQEAPNGLISCMGLICTAWATGCSSSKFLGWGTLCAPINKIWKTIWCTLDHAVKASNIYSNCRQ